MNVPRKTPQMPGGDDEEGLLDAPDGGEQYGHDALGWKAYNEADRGLDRLADDCESDEESTNAHGENGEESTNSRDGGGDVLLDALLNVEEEATNARDGVVKVLLEAEEEGTGQAQEGGVGAGSRLLLELWHFNSGIQAVFDDVRSRGVALQLVEDGREPHRVLDVGLSLGIFFFQFFFPLIYRAGLKESFGV